MAKTLDQVPAIVNITIMLNNDYRKRIKFNKDMTGYGFEAKVNVDGIEKDITVDTGDLSIGEIFLFIPKELITETGTYRWYLKWVLTGDDRDIFMGNITIKDYT